MEYLDDIQSQVDYLIKQRNGVIAVQLTAWDGNITKIESTRKTTIKLGDLGKLLDILELLLNESVRMEYDGTMNLAIVFKNGKLKEITQTNEERKKYGE